MALQAEWESIELANAQGFGTAASDVRQIAVERMMDEAPFEFSGDGRVTAVGCLAVEDERRGR